MPIDIIAFDGAHPIRVREPAKNVGELKTQISQLGTKIPKEEIRLFSKINPDADELADDAEVHSHMASGLLLVKKKAPPAPAADGAAPPAAPEEFLKVADLAALLPNQNKSTVFGVHYVLEQIPSEHIDKESIKENDEVNPSWRANQADLFHQCTIINDKTREEVKEILNGRTVFQPFRMVAKDGGVELRATKSYTYRTATPAYAAEVKAAEKDRAAAIAHCQKLLVDLPVALATSQFSMKATADSDSPDLIKIGAMVVEQKKISTEIEIQKKKLAELTATPVPTLKKDRFTSYSKQASAVLKFGYNTIAGQTYCLMRKAHAVEVGEIDPLEVGEIKVQPPPAAAPPGQPAAAPAQAQRRLPDAIDAESA